jgi:hypothetical protein
VLDIFDVLCNVISCDYIYLVRPILELRLNAMSISEGVGSLAFSMT